MIFNNRKSETRSASGDATANAIEAIELAAHGGIDGFGTAVYETCAGLWERSIASALVGGVGGTWGVQDARLLALVGRDLARKGESLFVIDVDGAGSARLLPAASFDVRSGGSEESSWLYRCDLIGPSGSTSVDHPNAAVLHFRIGADSRRPWRGRSPLEIAAGTGRLSGLVENSLEREARIPVARLLTNPGASAKQSELFLDSVRSGGLFLWSLGGYGSTADQNPQRSGKIAPEPDPETVRLRTELRAEIMAAFGVPPSLFGPTGDGTGQREAWRRFWASVISPIGMMIQAEIRTKLDAPDCQISFPSLRASDEDGRSRAVSRRAQAFKILREAGVDSSDAMRLSGLE